MEHHDVGILLESMSPIHAQVRELRPLVLSLLDSEAELRHAAPAVALLGQCFPSSPGDSRRTSCTRFSCRLLPDGDVELVAGSSMSQQSSPCVRVRRSVRRVRTGGDGGAACRPMRNSVLAVFVAHRSNGQFRSDYLALALFSDGMIAACSDQSCAWQLFGRHFRREGRPRAVGYLATFAVTPGLLAVGLGCG